MGVNDHHISGGQVLPGLGADEPKPLPSREEMDAAQDAILKAAEDVEAERAALEQERALLAAEKAALAEELKKLTAEKPAAGAPKSPKPPQA